MKRRRPARQPLAVLLLTTIFATGAAAAVPQLQPRSVAVTIDDGPWTGGPDDVDAATAANQSLLAALAAHAVPATLFVTGSRVVIGGQQEVGERILRDWRDAGQRLENHSFSHPALSTAAVADYLRDVQQGHDVVSRLLQEADPTSRVGFFRAPFNDTGADVDRRDALLHSLQRSAVRLAPFTVEHADYVFNQLYVDATSRGDRQLAGRIADAYLAQLDVAFDFAEALAAETFGRTIPQVFLIHANAINAAFLDAMLDRLAARGYRFVGLAEALEDPAYATPTGEPNRWGWSWLHRWRAGLGLESRLRAEPDPPVWVMQAAAALEATR